MYLSLLDVRALVLGIEELRSLLLSTHNVMIFVHPGLCLPFPSNTQKDKHCLTLLELQQGDWGGTATQSNLQHGCWP